MARPAKSTAAHKRDGTLNVTRHRDRVDEVLAIGEPTKPKGLDKVASELWDTVIDGRPPEASAAVDAAALEGICRWFSSWKKYMAIGDYKSMVLAAMCWKHFSTMAGQFGMTPASRARLKLPPKPKDEDAFAAIINSRSSLN